MGFLNREIELKMLLTNNYSYSAILNAFEMHLTEYYPEYEVISSKASDYYWDAPEQSNADFIRLRKQDSGKGGIITIKTTDKGSNVDRVEIDVDIESFKQGLALMTSLYGKAREKVTKKYNVFFLENEHTNYSIYQIDKDKRIFVEVEARSGARVVELIESFINKFPHLTFDSVQSSIFEMFVCKKDPKINTLQEGLTMISKL